VRAVRGGRLRKQRGRRPSGCRGPPCAAATSMQQCSHAAFFLWVQGASACKLYATTLLPAPPSRTTNQVHYATLPPPLARPTCASAASPPLCTSWSCRVIASRRSSSRAASFSALLATASGSCPAQREGGPGQIKPGNTDGVGANQGGASRRQAEGGSKGWSTTSASQTAIDLQPSPLPHRASKVTTQLSCHPPFQAAREVGTASKSPSRPTLSDLGTWGSPLAAQPRPPSSRARWPCWPQPGATPPAAGLACEIRGPPPWLRHVWCKSAGPGAWHRASRAKQGRRRQQGG
jgi:hypothetical protein